MTTVQVLNYYRKYYGFSVTELLDLADDMNALDSDKARKQFFIDHNAQ